ncbi:MAG: preprotein translocase subunit SecG [Chlamydiae bacterium]|nr:preprotein translocase subunit SecG [Chlamydiota bacterium]
MMFLFYTTICLFLLLCALLSGVILLQESKSMGLGASFGGDTGDSLFGTSTADVLKKITAWLAFIFMGACIILSLWSAGIGHAKVKNLPLTIEQEVLKK